MVDTLPKALAAAVDRNGSASPAPAAEKKDAEASAKAALAKKLAAAAKPAAEKPAEKPAEAPAPKEERESIAQLRKLAANYEITPEQIMKYLAANPKVKERFGAIDGVAFADIPDAIVSWLCKGMEKVAAKIKG
jgi:type VI protein secretion system component VasK